MSSNNAGPKATLVITWPAGTTLTTREMFILVDGKQVADLPQGVSRSIPISPGHHKVAVTNRLFTGRVDIDAGEGETVRFVTDMKAPGCLAPIAVFMGTPALTVTLRRDDR